MSNHENRISKLEEELERIKKYTIIRDGVWIEEYIDSVKEYLINYNNIGDDETTMRLELDNLIMCHARMKEDFMEYCRRAALQMEGFMEWAIKKKMRDRKVVKNAWDKAQKKKKERRDNHKVSSLPSIDKIDYAGLDDYLETSFILFYRNNFYEYGRIRDQFFCLAKTNSIRNIASHGSEEGDWESRMTSSQRKFYKNRDEKYREILDNMEVIKSKIVNHFRKLN